MLLERCKQARHASPQRCPSRPCLLQVDALQETLQRLERADDVLLRLTEDKAALTAALQESRATAEGAAAAAEARAAAAEADAAELRRQLEAAAAQEDAAHATLEAAADQMQALADSHEELERQLAAAAADADTAHAELAQRARRECQLEESAAAADEELRQALNQRDAAVAQLQMLLPQLAAAQQAAAEQQREGGVARERLQAAWQEREELAGRLRSVADENGGLRESLKARCCCRGCMLTSCRRSSLIGLLWPALLLHTSSRPVSASSKLPGAHLLPSPHAGAAMRVRGGAAAERQRGGRAQPAASGRHV